jgi:dihydrofolate synthase / folylpolyglutamate synthase
MADKDYRSMLGELVPWAEQRIYVAPEGRRAADPAALASFIPGQVASSAAEAIRIGRRAVGRDGLVLVTGSIFLVGAVRALLLDLPRDPAVGL